MSLVYSLAYWLGVTPWENAVTHPDTVRHINALFDREERKPPYGRALDLGCGRGHWSVILAQRGWDVIGVDLVPRAIRAARQNAASAGVEARFVQGDVTTLRESGIGPNFRLVWDFGTVHNLDRRQRRAVGREITAVTADDATVLIMAWAPGRRGPLPGGASRAEIEAAFAGWTVADEEPLEPTFIPRPFRSVAPRIYRLHRAF